ncbi:cytochrome c biogenesis protein ResB [Labilibaculum sp.]|uniref:cytochrome c biogenesis protein ResB n=1 Tax=Labilibaculum sp. TaxID=2060723 RepID=UPI002AA80B3C|nr:cytochrome c biogenesis protein ResB [Labilibaculum sp.]
MTKNTKPLWQSPWGYSESFLMTFGLLLIGFTLEFTVGSASFGSILFPQNMILGTVYILLIALVYVLIRKKPIFKFLSGISASIGAIAGLSILVVIMGITPQIPMENKGIVTSLGFNRLTTSIPFLFINLYLLFILGMVVVRKLFPLKWKNWGFICSHLGLWITVFAAGLGSGDLQRLRMDLNENRIEGRAYDDKGNYFELPLAIKLNDFKIEEFHPKLAVVDNTTGNLYEATKPSMIMIENDLNCKLNDWEIIVDEFFVTSGRAGDRYYSLVDLGAAPAAKVRVISSGRDTISGWISCGSFNRPHESLKIDDRFSLLMTVPEPKRFSSEVSIFTPDGKRQEQTLEVNKSFTVNGWKIYQLSYDEKMGIYSTKSIVEVVKDPWQVFVYIGVFMMMIGSVYMFWRGNKVKNEEIHRSVSN